MRFKRGVRLGRPFGIPLVVHGSWFPAAVLLVVHFALTAYAGMPGVAAVGLALATTILFFASLVAHELGHALVARSLGIPVVDITLFIFGGVARIAREPSRPAQEVVVAAAGPAVSLALGLGGLALRDSGALFETLGLANLALAIFNLLPGFPLDGGRILRAVLWARRGDQHGAALTAGRSGQLLGLGIGMTGAGLFVFLRAATEGAWLIVVGGFLYALATGSRRAAAVAAHLGREAAGTWVRPFAGTVSPDAPLSSLQPVDGEVYAVSSDGRLSGVLLPSALRGPVRAARAGDVMVPWRSRLACLANEPLTRALERLHTGQDGVLVVMDAQGAVLGVLDHARVRSRFVRGRRPRAEVS